MELFVSSTPDFCTFVLSLRTSALVSLGLVADPASGQKLERSDDLALETLHLLRVLEAKTAGNLSGDEEQLLSRVIDDLNGHLQRASKSDAAR